MYSVIVSFLFQTPLTKDIAETFLLIPCDLFYIYFSSGPQEFCHLETFNASCPHDTVIVMQSARYGRMKVGNCVKRNLGYVGCAVDVIRYMDAHCSGRSSCRVSIVDLAKTEMKPCPEDVTSYLEASYQCLPGTVC